MKSRNSEYLWIPLWIDKWIFGSTRIECSLEERGIWVDFMALAGKDEGFIRANETTPYAIEQLAGLLIVPKDVLIKAIETFVRVGKLEDLNGIYKIKNWDVYKLSDAHKRVILHRLRKAVTKSVTGCNEKRTTNKIKSNQIRSNNNKNIFTKPTIEEVTSYCKERENGIDPQKWFDYYSANGWRVGKNPMKDWRAAVRTWERKGGDGIKPAVKCVYDNNKPCYYDCQGCSAVKLSKKV